MRILVVSDIHGNWEALKAVIHQARVVDEILCLGDIVDYGPEHKACVSWVKGAAGAVVRGNHDNAAAFHVSCQCSPTMRDLSELTRQEAWKQLDEDDLRWLGAQKHGLDLERDGARIHMVHATPDQPLYAYLRPVASEWSRPVKYLDADLVLVGHTHLPMVLQVGDKLVVNPGSVGQPRDGDTRAAYAIIEDSKPTLCRAEYDVDATVAQLERSALPTSAVARLAHLLRGGDPWLD